MRPIPVSILFLILLFISTFYASALFAADAASAGSSSVNSTTSAPSAPMAPSATPAAKAPGATKYINNNASQTEPADSSLEDECKKPRNPGDPEKDDKCFERRTVK